jgi:hypothetical protein
MNNTVTSTMSKIPGIGDIPVLGYLFRSRAYQKQQTELVVMITPTIIRRGAPGVSQGLPSAVEPYLGAPAKALPQPPAYTGSPRYPVNPNEKPKTSSDAAPAASSPVASSPSSSVTVPQSRPATPVTAATAQPMNAAPAASSSPAPVKPAAPVQPTATDMSSPVQPAQPVTQAVAPSAHSTAVVTPKPHVDPKALEAEKRRNAETAKAKAEQDRKNAEAKKVADRKAAEEKAIADRKAAEEKAAADKKAAEQQARQAKLDEERAKREAIVARKNAEADRKKQDDQKKREKSLNDAAERLREAQAAYQAEMEKAGSKGNANDKPKGGVQ